MSLPITQISSIGSGTIIVGRRSAYVNDLQLTSGSIVVVTLQKENSKAAGAGGLKSTVYTTGSPSNGQSFQVLLNGVAEKNIPFTYAIISGTDVIA